MVRCACGLEAVIRTTLTNRNPGHHFYGCLTLSPTFVSVIRWFDPPMCQRSVQISIVEVMGYGVVDECGFEFIVGMNRRTRALEQEMRNLDVQNKRKKNLKASYGVTTPQELRRNQN
ncbi:hypothetical protein Tco_0242960 [Tanacetum coccineum]